MEKPTIAVDFISGTFPPVHCGVGIYSDLLLNGLRLANPEIKLTVVGSSKSLPEPVITQDKWSVYAVQNLIWRLKKSQNKIAHIQYPTTAYKRNIGINILPLLIRIFTNKKVVVTIHELHELGLLARVRTLITCLGANKIITTNEWDRSQLPSFLKKHSEVIQIGSNITKSKNHTNDNYQKLLDKIGMDQEKKTVFFFGKVSKNKGVEHIIKAVSSTDKHQLVISGDYDDSDPYHQYIRSLVGEHSKNNHIKWAGFLDNDTISIILSGCDYFCIAQSSPISTKSGTLLAALQHGCITIIPGGHQDDLFIEPLQHLYNTWLYTGQPVEGITKALAELDNNIELGRVIKKAAVNTFDNYFSWSEIAKKHLVVYEGLVDKQ